jgi:Raf kinase inhibitor-like YbhB/YbcL family protein
MNSVLRGAAAISILSLFALSANAQNASAPAQGGPPVLAKNLVPARMSGRLVVTSPAFTSGKTLDEKYTQSGANMSPPIAWTRGPAGTQSYVLLAEDSGVNRAEPIVHWIVYNIPSGMRYLPSEAPGDTSLPGEVKQGKNVSGSTGYLGPKPPAGQTHPYHFQVFALSKRLDIDPANADRATVINAMKGSVLASGDVIGTYTGQ